MANLQDITSRQIAARKISIEDKAAFNPILRSLVDTGKWFGDLDNDLYHRLPGLSSSEVRRFSSEGKYEYYHGLTNPSKSTDAMKLSSAIHSILLEDAPFVNDESLYQQILAGGGYKPSGIRNTTDYIAQVEVWRKNGLIVLRDEMFKSATVWKKETKTNEKIKDIFSQDVLVEKSVFILLPSGLIMKCRPDAFNPETGVLIDLKALNKNNWNPKKWSKNVEKFGWHIQAAHYTHVLERYTEKEIKLFPFICFMKEGSNRIGVRVLGQQHQEDGVKIVKDVIGKLQMLYCTGNWGNIVDDEIVISHPTDYYINQMNGFNNDV